MKLKILVLLIIFIISALVSPLCVSAAAGLPNIPAFDGIQNGDGKYLNSQYRDNYHLDIKELSLMEGGQEILNNVANVLFGILHGLAYLAMVLFYNCFSFDIAELFGIQITAIQLGLRRVIFDGFFLLAFATSAFFIIKQLLQRNLQAMLGEVLKVVVILVISYAIGLESKPFLSMVNNIAKEISLEALGEISRTDISSSNGDIDSYAADAAGILWSGLVHQPWLALEYGEYTGDFKVDEILSKGKNDEVRKGIVKGIYEDDKKETGVFEADVGVERIIFLIFISAPILIKCALYIFIAFLQMAFQLLTLFYVLTCPLILVMAISPSLGGMGLVGNWLRKIVETQLGVLILTLIIGLVVQFDKLFFAASGNMWVVGLWLQTFAMVALIWQWEKVLKFMTGVTRTIQNPQQAMQKFNNSGNVYKGIEGAAHEMPRIARKINNMAAWGTSRSLPKSYRDLPQYEPPKFDVSGSSDTTPPASPTQAVASASSAQTTDAQAKTKVNTRPNNVIDFKKIPRYESKTQNVQSVAQPRVMDKAVNGTSETTTSGKATNFNEVLAAVQRPQTVATNAVAATGKTNAPNIQKPYSVVSNRVAGAARDIVSNSGRTTPQPRPYSAVATNAAAKAQAAAPTQRLQTVVVGGGTATQAATEASQKPRTVAASTGVAPMQPTAAAPPRPKTIIDTGNNGLFNFKIDTDVAQSKKPQTDAKNSNSPNNTVQASGGTQAAQRPRSASMSKEAVAYTPKSSGSKTKEKKPKSVKTNSKK